MSILKTTTQRLGETGHLITTNVFGIDHGGTTWVYVGASGTIYSIDNGEDDVTARTSGTTEHLRRAFYKE